MLYLNLLFLTLTTILAISWIYYYYMSNWVGSQAKELSMTVTQFITSVSPEFNFKVKKKKKINNNRNKHGCRKYISANVKEELRELGTNQVEKRKFMKLTRLPIFPPLSLQTSQGLISNTTPIVLS